MRAIGECHAWHAFEAFVGGEHHRIDLRLGRQIERQRAKCRHRIDDEPAAKASHHGADRRDVVHDAAAGLAVDQPDMADIGIRRQCGGDRGGFGGCDVG